jgi:oligoribonuclease NrnB/cAMP/cGMP phosphodiesterase (DHH superfamily)
MSMNIYTKALTLDIKKIITDSDLDGIVTAAILKRWWPNADVIFGHPGNLRAGMMDGLIDRNTAICDLPRHPNCGLSIDHHKSNAPKERIEENCVILWEETPSAARIAYNLLKEKIDLSDLSETMLWVDKLDGGSISIDEFKGDNKVLWLGRIIGSSNEITMKILENIENRKPINEILNLPDIRLELNERLAKQEYLNRIIKENLYIIDRLAIARLENLKIRSNGYLVTAIAGEECDACMVIHGDIGATFEEEENYPVSASFYTNSFLHKSGGIFDLTKLATNFDLDGGGHADACGCRIKSIDNKIVTNREVVREDIESNIDEWLKIWSQR